MIAVITNSSYLAPLHYTVSYPLRCKFSNTLGDNWETFSELIIDLTNKQFSQPTVVLEVFSLKLSPNKEFKVLKMLRIKFSCECNKLLRSDVKTNQCELNLI